MPYKKDKNSVLVMVPKDSFNKETMQVADDMEVVWVDQKDVMDQLDVSLCLPKNICDCLIKVG